MLSKSSARKFFLVGTALCSVSFILLTVDTIRRVPEQTHQANLTPEAIRGKHLFDRSNCMGCHTIMGEGAYYAPELTKVVERRGPEFIKAILKDPAAMYPGERKMVNYRFSESQIQDLLAFLTWVGQMDLNGFPPKPDLGGPAASQAKIVSLTSSASAAEVERPQVFGQVCLACHSIGGSGGKVGPALDDIGSRRNKDFLVSWLKDPMAIKPDSKMPKLPLGEADIESLANYLSRLKGAVK